jgi:predicted acetyltransferase
MELKLNWTGDRDRVAETRLMCYAAARKELPRFREMVEADGWSGPGDYLLAERGSRAVGTATSISFNMWIRGVSFSCQGVAWVGAVKSARRQGGTDPGVASAVMKEIVRMGRERGHVVSALMPFRVSFYEHFGYGVVERRGDWTVPLSVVPHGHTTGWRFAEPGDYEGPLVRHWQRSTEAGQCDVERSARRWSRLKLTDEEGMCFVREAGGEIDAMVMIVDERTEERRNLRVVAFSPAEAGAIAPLLSFLGTMRDQYSAAVISVPADWQINRLLREPQVPHRPVDHATAQMRLQTRMSMRILDHRKYLESLKWPAQTKGRVTIGVSESEGGTSRFGLEIEAGRATVKPATGEADFECRDIHWAAIATSDLKAGDAVRWNLARQSGAAASRWLEEAFAGPAPFCREAF